ncbi:CD209 antigen-like protein D isoform X2 [Neoarius graeffei]|uniref:CD209 antigen-like protein D isoform X2 n=1 Tax=Neoarius graeffei TaxID=443677 RepID=UPI00298D37A4|nr:CD209 antigen-like protein D isoform X2 [Neoarius graeffei]
MEAKKVAEVEMKEITPEEVQDNKDIEKGEMEGTKEAVKEAEKEEKEEKESKEEGGSVYCKLKNPTEEIYNLSASTSTCDKEAEKKAEKEQEITEEGGNVYSKLKNPTEDVYHSSMSASTSKRNEAEKKAEIKKEDEDDVYCKLNDPSENVYMAAMTSSSAKHNKDVYTKLRHCRRISALFIVLSLLLLVVVLALAIKSHEVQSSQKCLEQSPQAPGPAIRRPHEVYEGADCGRGWLIFNNTCYFMSRELLSWQKSREACQKRGGDLIVINSEHVQKFLTRNIGLMYWIGLRYSDNQHWRWINNTAPNQNYWADNQPDSNSEESCALIKGMRLLRGRSSSLKSWYSNRCGVNSRYICRRD